MEHYMPKMNSLLKLSTVGLVAFAAACGGADEAAEAPAAAEPVVTAEAPAAAATPAGTVHTVRMLTTNGGASGVFEPAEITVKRGDTVRWIQEETGAAHNVSFAPAINQGIANLPPQSPYLTTAGQTYDLVMDMEPGTFNYQCDPHAMMGMVGKVTVAQ